MNIKPQLPKPTLAELLDFPVHPFASKFPMFAEDELEELAEDIKANGLEIAILVSSNGVLLDGRNRREACRRIGYQPAVEFFEGDDIAIVAKIISLNAQRRNLTKGQRAMAIALAYPEPEQRGRGNKSLLIKDFSLATLSQARAVNKIAPEMAESILGGALPLGEAYKLVKDRENAAQSATARMEKLRALSPELATMVAEGSLGFDAAFTEIEDRKRKNKERRETAIRLSENAISALGTFATDSFAELFTESTADPEFALAFKQRISLSPNDLANLKRGFDRFNQMMEMVK